MIAEVSHKKWYWYLCVLRCMKYEEDYSFSRVSMTLLIARTIFAADAPVIIGGVEMSQVETSVDFEQMKKKLRKWEGLLM